MAHRLRSTGRWTAPMALLLGVALLAGCSAKPVSEAVESVGPASPAPVETATTPAESAPPASAEPGESAPPESTPPETADPGAGIPDKPADVTWEQVGTQDVGGGVTRVTHRITWTAPKGVARTFTVVGVTRCLRDAKPYNDKPCLVRGMPIPKAVQKVITEVPGSARSVDISWKEGELGGGPYQSILIRASNAAGDSIFTIVWTANVCWRCTY